MPFESLSRKFKRLLIRSGQYGRTRTLINASQGQLFSRLYIEKGNPVADSKRFRARLAAHFDSYSINRDAAADTVRKETGLNVPMKLASHGLYIADLEKFVQSVDIIELLDTITIVFRSFNQYNIDETKLKYRIDVERMFREENLSYKIDSLGGIHFYVDEEFERSRSAAVSGLSSAQYRAALDAYDDSHRSLLSGDNLSAVRRSFDAVENVFKLAFQVSRLGASEIKSKLNPVLAVTYSGRGLDAANRLSASFAEWVNAAHQYRHAPGEADPSPPTQDLAILMVSGASSYLRWLIGLTAA